MAIWLTFVALLIEIIVGYPDRLVRAIGHPVMWIGALIGALDRMLNRKTLSDGARRAAGGAAVLVLLAVAAGVAVALERGLTRLPYGLAAEALVASTLIAQRSLHRHVADVAAALETRGLVAGRRAVAHIVGRDPDALNEAGVARAAIESLAENFSDGIVAPVFWLAVGGLVGGACYKAINTADSMIGHRTSRHAAFGFVAARLDDLVNLPASRLTALLIVAAAAVTPGASPAAGWRAVIRDAPRHRSPNAGWPEAAMAGALGLKLAGLRVYAGVAVDDATMGDGRSAATAADIRAALALYRRADALLIGLVAALALILG
ncbi:MAG TPA: adenosylcobinamide-phosphate synthase CbiB [Xanthobacteraceae bacterium]|nr:adenosylcobinamide-phosphate synthase CbiB [Xanthobacteraceae bacterium]